jgi:hypothetical protein
MSLEEFESVSGLVNNIKRKFPDKLPTDFVGEIGLAKLQGQQHQNHHHHQNQHHLCSHHQSWKQHRK